MKRPHTSPNCDCAGCVEHDKNGGLSLERDAASVRAFLESLDPGNKRHAAQIANATKTLRDLERVLEAAKKATGA